MRKHRLVQELGNLRGQREQQLYVLQDLGVDRGKLELLGKVGRLYDVLLRELPVFHVLVMVSSIRLRLLLRGCFRT